MGRVIEETQMVSLSRDAAANIVLACGFGSAFAGDRDWTFVAGLLMGVALIMIVLVMRSDLARLKH